MRIIVVFITGIITIVGGLLMVIRVSSSAELAQDTPLPFSFKYEEKRQRENTGVPLRVIIPSIGINAAVESVGLDEQDRMAVPEDPDNAAWYNLGRKTGETGSVVLAGHFDNEEGQPAVFYHLEDLQKDDVIIVRDVNNMEYEYKVMEIKTYEHDKVPLEEVFNSNDKKRLNLITCAGSFDKISKNYSNRTVVYAVAN